MIAIGLDQSLRVTGYSIWDGQKLVECGKFEVSKALPIEQRLKEFYNTLTNLFNKYHFEVLFFEDISQQINVLTTIRLAFVQAIVYLWCAQHNIDYMVLAPTHWRKILTEKYGIKWGKKRAEQKKTAQQFVKEQFNVDATQDEADSICLSLAALLENEPKENKKITFN